MGQMSEDELKAIIEHEIDHAIDSELDTNCDKALDYYLGEEPKGNGIENRSQVVSRDLADTVEWLLPDIIRTFMSSDDFVRFEPEGQEDVEQAEQESDYCNYVFDKDNNGYLLMYSWVKDALLFKNGYVKAWWEEKETQKQDSYEGMTDDEFAAFYSDNPDLKITEHTAETREIPIFTEMGLQKVPMLVHDFSCEKKTKTGKVKIEPVPRNEIYVSRKTRTVNVTEAPFVAHIRKRALSDLIEEGYSKDKLDKIGGGSLGRGTDYHRLERFVINSEDDDWTESADESRHELWVAECYILADYDGDGRSEMRKVTLAGDTILDNERADRNPFHCIAPIIMAHNHQGLSFYDLVKDLQEIRTTLWRQTLDSLYFANNQRTVINENVNLEDLLTVRPQGVVRTSGVPANDVMPFPVAQIAGDTFPMLGMLDDVGRQRTGVDPGMGNLDPNVLKNVNTAPFLEVSQARKGRVELIVRTFAETGIKSLFLHIHELLQKHQKQPRIIKLRENYVPVSPTEWKDRTNMTINVGLGTGNKQEKLMNMQLIAAAQEKLYQFGLVGPKEATSSFEEISQNAGYKDWQRFCKPADQAEPPQEQQDPTTELMKMQLEIERERNQITAAKMQVDQQKMQLEHQQKVLEFERKAFETQSKQDIDQGKLMQAVQEGQQLNQREWEKIQQRWVEINQTFDTKLAELSQKDMQARESNQLQREGMNNRGDNETR